MPANKASAKVVADAAIALADALKPHAKLLRSAGMEKEFLSEMRSEARALALVVRETERLRVRRSQVTRDIKNQLDKGMDVVKVIEGIILWHFRKEKVTIGAWEHARKVPAKMGRPKAKRAGPARAVAIA